MRICRCLQAAVALASLALSLTLLGQFQPPTPEELAMKDEPKAPGAAAVYLYREETVDDNLHYHSFFARIKVLTEKGKELATVQLPYEKGTFTIADVKGRTIHPDGTIVALNVKPTDLVDQRAAGVQLNKVVFTLPSVEVGSILEYKWQLRYDDQTLSSPYWDIQQHYFVRKAHYSFFSFRHMDQITDSNGNLANKLLYSTMLPRDVKVNYEQTTGKYTVDITDVAPIPDEEFMLPIEAWLESVKFYYSPYYNQEDFWKHEGERWSKEMNHFASESKGLKEAVGQLVSAGDSEDVKAHKLYDAVMALDNTDYTRRKTKAELKQMGLKQTKQAEDVWKQKSGSSDEIALLYLAMARIAGLKAYAMIVCNRNQEIFNQNFLSLRQLDDVLVLVTIGGKETIVDPGTRYVSFGELAWKHTVAGGIRQSEKGVVFGMTTTNSYKTAVTLRTADVTVAKDGAVTGIIRVSLSGPAAVYWRHLVIQNDEDEVKKQFNESMRGLVPEGVTAEFDHFLGLDDYHSQLMGIMKISGNMGTATGKRMLLPGVFFESRAKHPFVTEEKRESAVDMEYAETVREEVTYHVPESFSVESSPAETSIPWAGHAAFQIKSKTDKDGILVVRHLIRGFALVAPNDYSGLRDFYQKVATADQQQLVLTAAPAIKGN